MLFPVHTLRWETGIETGVHTSTHFLPTSKQHERCTHQNINSFQLPSGICVENCDWKHGIRLVDPGCLQQAATETILSVCLCGSGGGFGFLKIFVHHNSPWNVKPALSPRRRGPSQLAVRILPRAFLVFIFRQHEIWPTLVFTKEQTGAVWPWRIRSSNTSCLLVGFFLLPTYSLQLTWRKGI